MAEPSFWTIELTHYLREHRHPRNRLTHFVGIPILLITPVVALITLDWRWLVGGQLVGWAIQLLGHRIEGNRPVLLQRPIAFVVGPIMVLVELLGLVGLRPRFAVDAHAALAAEDALSSRTPPA